MKSISIIYKIYKIYEYQISLRTLGKDALGPGSHMLTPHHNWHFPPVTSKDLLFCTANRCCAETASTPASHAPVIMSRRTLGGGRVLGNPSALTSAPSPQPKPRVLSPTASSVSLNSQAASQLSTETQDLTSRISIENGDTSISAAPAAPGAQLSCPICSEQMVCLFRPVCFLKGRMR